VVAALAVTAGCGGGGGGDLARPSGPQVVPRENLEVQPLALRRDGREVMIDLRLHNVGDSVDSAAPATRGHLVVGGQRPAVLATGECPGHTGFPPGVALAPDDTVLGCLLFVPPAGARATAFRFGDTGDKNAPEWSLETIPTGGPAHIRDVPAALPHGVGTPATLRGEDYSAAPSDSQAPDNEQQLEITVLKKVDNPPALGTPPEDGLRLVAVQVRIDNTGTRPYYPYVESDVALWDSTSHVHDTNGVTATTLGTWPDGPIAPGATVTGYLTFEVPAGAQLTRFEWVLSQGGKDAAAYWELF
jgi:Domain of unknown function (DUF4352)